MYYVSVCLSTNIPQTFRLHVRILRLSKMVGNIENVVLMKLFTRVSPLQNDHIKGN